MNAKKLKAKIVENGLSVSTTAELVGISRSSLYRKLRGDDKFTIYEAGKLKDVLRLTNLEALEIFL